MFKLELELRYYGPEKDPNKHLTMRSEPEKARLEIRLQLAKTEMEQKFFSEN